VEEGAEHVPGGSWSRGRACSLEEVGLDDGGGGHRRGTDLLDAVLDQIGKDRTWDRCRNGTRDGSEDIVPNLTRPMEIQRWKRGATD
jgi:hypothetical protein